MKFSQSPRLIIDRGWSSGGCRRNNKKFCSCLLNFADSATVDVIQCQSTTVEGTLDSNESAAMWNLVFSGFSI